jgi:putative phosphoesterase
MTHPRPLLGILSDSHRRRKRTAEAVSMLRAGGATILLHLGDLEDPAILEELVGVEAHVVPGNMDDPGEIASVARSLGVHCPGDSGEIVVAERRVAFTHGHRSSEILRLLACEPAYLLHGHTHIERDERLGNTRIVNPGALHRAMPYTVALLDPSTGRLDRLIVP